MICKYCTRNIPKPTEWQARGQCPDCWDLYTEVRASPEKVGLMLKDIRSEVVDIPRACNHAGYRHRTHPDTGEQEPYCPKCREYLEL